MLTEGCSDGAKLGMKDFVEERDGCWLIEGPIEAGWRAEEREHNSMLEGN